MGTPRFLCHSEPFCLFLCISLCEKFQLQKKHSEKFCEKFCGFVIVAANPQNKSTDSDSFRGIPTGSAPERLLINDSVTLMHPVGHLHKESRNEMK